VLSGNATLIVNGENFAVSEGDSVSYNSHLPHKLINDGHAPFRALWNALPPHKDYLEEKIIARKNLVGGGSIPLPAAAFGVLRHPLLGAPLVGVVARINRQLGGTHEDWLAARKRSRAASIHCREAAYHSEGVAET